MFSNLFLGFAYLRSYTCKRITDYSVQYSFFPGYIVPSLKETKTIQVSNCYINQARSSVVISSACTPAEEHPARELDMEWRIIVALFCAVALASAASVDLEDGELKLISRGNHHYF